MKQRAIAARPHRPSPRRGPFFPAGPRRAGPGAARPFFQPQLEIGATGDPFEREADRVADQVVAGGGAPAVQRMCAECSAESEHDEEEELRAKPDPALQRAPAGDDEGEERSPEAEAGGRPIDRDSDLLLWRSAAGPPGDTASPRLSADVASLEGGGRALPDDLRGFMEPRFGRDLGAVRIHTDGRAASMARQARAQAFTVGEHIVFGAGRFDPRSTDGRRLVAHELTHTIQQAGAGGLRRRLQRAVCSSDPAPPGLGCTPATSGSPLPTRETIAFPINGSALDFGREAVLQSFVQAWHNEGGVDLVRVDGFASCDGGAAANWTLSCNRANAVATALNAPPPPARGIPFAFLDVFANGETDLFSPSTLDDNRVVVLSTNAPIPPPSSRRPSVVRWVTSVTGTTAGDDCCAACPRGLGVDSAAGYFGNGIEMQALLADHDAAYGYDIKRTKETRYWRRLTVLGTPFWFQVTAWNSPAGTSDDAGNHDECLATIVPPTGNPYIYSVDQPGFRPTALTGSYTDYVQMANFIEWVRITPAGGTAYDDPVQLRWHTVLWITNSGGTWSVDTGRSTIGTGHHGSLTP